jgi:hypothetical protein
MLQLSAHVAPCVVKLVGRFSSAATDRQRSVSLVPTSVRANQVNALQVMTIAIKRYSTPANRGFAYGLFYTVMNLAALANGILVDYLRIWLCDGFNITSLPDDHWLNNGNRLVVASGAVTSVIGLGVSLCFRRGELTGVQREVAMIASLELDQADIVSSPLAAEHEAEPRLSRYAVTP